MRLNFDFAATAIAFVLVLLMGLGFIWIFNLLLDKIFGRGG